MSKEVENQEDVNNNEETQTPQMETENTDTADKVAENETTEQTDWQDKYMRLSAEFDNFRKRTVKEKMELVEAGGKDVLGLMIQTVDDFDRALEHITDEDAKNGVELIYQKFLSALQTKGVVAMELIGKPFDVDTAEAIAKMPAPSPEQSGQVMDVAQKGYMIGDKVLRFAKVVVFE